MLTLQDNARSCSDTALLFHVPATNHISLCVFSIERTTKLEEKNSSRERTKFCSLTTNYCEACYRVSRVFDWKADKRVVKRAVCARRIIIKFAQSPVFSLVTCVAINVFARLRSTFRGKLQ